MLELSGYFAFIAMGLVLGLIGGGGSILTVPILVYLFQITPRLATGSSLFIVGTTALFTSLTYYQRKQIDLSLALTFALPSLLGVSVARAFLLPALPESLFQIASMNITRDYFIMALFATLMLVASLSMIQARKIPTSSTPMPLEKSSLVHSTFWKLALSAFLIGILTGTVGAGGGFLIVPTLMYITHQEMKQAVGTSLLVIAISSLIGFGVDAVSQKDIQWLFLFSLTAIAFAGAFIGSLISNKFKSENLKKYFGWFVLISGSFILLQQTLHQIQ